MLPPAKIAALVVAHYRKHARDLPWRRGTPDPYGVWICEIMAQQTRLDVVIPYWERWLERFPSIAALAAAPLDDVLASWAGLGYYARARSLHKAAQQIAASHGGALPDDVDGLTALPGIGPYTAGAIASIAFGRRAALVDGNVARILARLYGIEDDVSSPAARRLLWQLAGDLVPATAPGDFNQGLMDLGATICTPRSPRCAECPLATPCVARRDARQADLPVLPAKKNVPAFDVDVAWTTQGDAVLLMRRAPSGLFGGLWELPTLRQPPTTKPLATHLHKLTHRTLTYRVFAIDWPKPRPVPPYDAARFVPIDDLPQLGLSSAMSTLISRMKETQWPTPTAHTSSSKKATKASSPASASSATRSRPTRTSPKPRAAPRAPSPR